MEEKGFSGNIRGETKEQSGRDCSGCLELSSVNGRCFLNGRRGNAACEKYRSVPAANGKPENRGAARSKEEFDL